MESCRADRFVRAAPFDATARSTGPLRRCRDNRSQPTRLILVDKVADSQRVSRSFTRAVLSEDSKWCGNATRDEALRPHSRHRSSREVFRPQSGLFGFAESALSRRPMRRVPTGTCPLVKSRSMASAAPAVFGRLPIHFCAKWRGIGDVSNGSGSSEMAYTSWKRSSAEKH